MTQHEKFEDYARSKGYSIDRDMFGRPAITYRGMTRDKAFTLVSEMFARSIDALVYQRTDDPRYYAVVLERG